MVKKLKTRVEEIRKLSDADLAKELEETYRRLFSLRLQQVTRQLTNHRELPKLRHQISRVKTIQRERQIARRLAEEVLPAVGQER
jgi:large subunit ribosomal protein L29